MIPETIELTDQQRADLVAARALILNPDNWVTGRFAADADGHNSRYASDLAEKFCAAGACLRVEYLRLGDETSIFELRPSWNLLNWASRRLFGPDYADVSLVNDHKGHAAVMQVFEYLLGPIEAVS